MSPAKTESLVPTHSGGCHCRAVRFEVDLDLSAPVGRCNCTLCTMRGANGALVKPAQLRLLAGEDCIGDYSWGGQNAHYHFCKRCGIHVFGRGDIPEVGGAYASVNVNCIDEVDPAQLSAIHWDGRHDNWQAGPRPTPWPVHT